ncbi:glycosyltransferase family protein [Anatilimnocola aggregata]|uniref:hypothetical protein n=1 Tax=Anatilimnocola aggregata TaxID=2528021 RepID=UPI0011A6B122|nr:hypothetical protein [Anatilimnocola aggregata]
MPLLLIAPIVVIFAPVLFANRSFAFRDGAHFYHPMFKWIASEWGQGRVPLWNPLENCGLPILADATSSIFYPGKLIFVLPLPFAYLYNLYIVGHVLLAAGLMYALARGLRASQPAAVLTAVAYACGGNVVFQYCNIVFLVGAAWLPAALLGIEEIVARRSWKGTLLLAVVLAMMILGGDPQMAYHALLAAGLRLVCSWFGKPAAKTEDSQPSLDVINPVTSSWWYPTLQLGVAATFAFLLAAVQIFPSSEATKSSERAAYKRPRNVFEAVATVRSNTAGDSLLKETPGEAIAAGIFGQPEKSSHQDRAYNFSISPWRMAEFLWPNVSGRIVPVSRLWILLFPGSSPAWTPSLYLGLLPFLVGVAALRFWRTDPTTRWLSWLVLIFALGSFGWYGLGWVVREFYATVLQGDSSKLSIGAPVGGIYWLMVTLLPTYIYFRYPAKLMVVAVCGLCAAGAINADRLFTNPSDRWVQRLKWFAYASVGLAFVTWCISDRLIATRMPPTQIFGPFDARGACIDVISAFLQAAIVAWLLQLLLQKMWAARSHENSQAEQARWQWLAVALTAVEIVVANAGLLSSAPAAMWSEPGPVAAAIRLHHEQRQGTQADGINAQLDPRFFRGGYQSWQPHSYRERDLKGTRMQDLTRWEHDSLFPKYHLPSGLPLVESYGSLKPLDYESLLLISREYSKLEFAEARVPAPTVLRIAAAEYLVLPADAEIPFADKITPPANLELPENVSLWQMKRTQPRAWVVHHVVKLPPVINTLDLDTVDQRARDVLTELRDGKPKMRDFAQVAVVETTEPLSAELLSVDSKIPSTAVCEFLLDEPQHVRIRTRLDRPGLMVVADSWNQGWQATLQPANSTDDKPSAPQPLTIHRTNRCFRGVELPAGEWIVDFRFRPQSFYRGGLISAASWLAAIALCGLAYGWRKR